MNFQKIKAPDQKPHPTKFDLRSEAANQEKIPHKSQNASRPFSKHHPHNKSPVVREEVSEGPSEVPPGKRWIRQDATIGETRLHRFGNDRLAPKRQKPRKHRNRNGSRDQGAMAGTQISEEEREG
ncbi:hypothetical protein H6P81_011845 [Aristolochia fimbriata]|uniref:Uncharacterized protein n=1 Tax=Aristolochia fimbriata TaxID=158543 RepID=A0AAV7EA35_ARIFI|nr:hypothetical protein H6P81_011845 [Aristolochia fimbriata]